ncbi:MAG: hypothetical protein H0T79_19475 [Deltaproteobacteria bacterium]|nr:hypothetical protein [Deltaproteobacteria bacterium]
MTILVACGACGDTPVAPDSQVTDHPEASACQPIGATGEVIRRSGNPRLIAGQPFTDGKLDLSIADPDVQRDAAGTGWNLYYAAAHATTFSATDKVPVIRNATSVDRQTWTVRDVPALVAAPEPTAWDHTSTETPTVAYNPSAAPDRRYLMLYAGANGMFPFPGYTFPGHAIGAAFSADGVTFTRVPPAQSKDGDAGKVLTGADVYPGTTGAIVADPELAFVDGIYHLWFSSFACRGASCETVHAYGVSHATSPDGITWTVLEAPVRSLLRASATITSGGAQPSVIYDARRCRWEMWLTSDAAGDTDAQPVVFNNMAGVWQAESMDGVTWFVNYSGSRDLAWKPAEPGEPLGLLTGADVAADDTGRLMLYVGFDDTDVPADFVLPDRTAQGFRPGVMTLNVATRDLP